MPYQNSADTINLTLQKLAEQQDEDQKIEALIPLVLRLKEMLAPEILNNANTHPDFIEIIPSVQTAVQYIEQHVQKTGKNFKDLPIDLTIIIYLLIGIAKFQIHYPQQQSGELTPYELAEQTLLKAVTLCELLPDKGGMLEADVKLELGDTLQCQANLLKNKGDRHACNILYKKAQDYFLEVITLKKAAAATPDAIGHVYHALSYAFLNQNNPNKALEYSNLALGCFEEAFGKNAKHPYIAAVYRAQEKIHSQQDKL